MAHPAVAERPFGGFWGDGVCTEVDVNFPEASLSWPQLDQSRRFPARSKFHLQSKGRMLVGRA